MTALADALPGLTLVTDPDILRTLGHDEAEWAPAVGAVRARSADDVARIVAACAGQAVPVVPRGAGTGLSGGPTRSTATCTH